MKHSGSIIIGLTLGLTLPFNARAVTEGAQLNPYSAIVDRNVFNLKEPPKPEPPKPPEQPPTKITLLGIVSGLGAKQVMFKSPVGTPPKETSYTLPEGERKDDFEVLAIDEQTGTVRLRNHGREEILTLAEHGMKPGGASVAVPGQPGLPGGRVPPPPITLPGQTKLPVPQASTRNAANSSVTTFGAGPTTPSRPLRISATSSGEIGVPGGVRNTANRLAGRVPTVNQTKIDPAEQMIMMEVNREITKQQVAEGLMPPLPPTPLTGK